MAVTFGSVGDIISVCLLIKDLLIALDGAQGSSADYQKCVRELYVLDTTLLQVEQLTRTHAAAPELVALNQAAQHVVDQCRASVAAFTKKIKKYEKNLGDRDQSNLAKSVARKLQWQVCQSDEVDQFRVEIADYSNAINMLLATATMALLKASTDKVESKISDVRSQTADILDGQAEAIRMIQGRLSANGDLISQGSSLTVRMTERVEWLGQLCSNLKGIMLRIIASNIAIYQEVLSISTVVKEISRPMSEDPFILEDALGRIAPVHLRFVTSWEALDAVLEIRFRGKRGFDKVKEKQYVLTNDADQTDLERSRELESEILPGQKINMSLIFRGIKGSHQGNTPDRCPHCHTFKEDSETGETKCHHCRRWYHHICEQGEAIEALNQNKRRRRFQQAYLCYSNQTTTSESHIQSGPQRQRQNDPEEHSSMDTDPGNPNFVEGMDVDTRGIHRVRICTRLLPYGGKIATRKATEADARMAGIPLSCALDDWDPDQEPVAVLGDIFDMSSLWSFLYDCTISAFGPGTPYSSLIFSLGYPFIKFSEEISKLSTTVMLGDNAQRDLAESRLTEGEALWSQAARAIQPRPNAGDTLETDERLQLRFTRSAAEKFVVSLIRRPGALEQWRQLQLAINAWTTESTNDPYALSKTYAAPFP